MNNHVLATIVTYNRLELLKRCVQYLQSQTYPADILVIDNASTDGTKNYLLESGIDHITQPNGGSSAGWWRSIDEARKRRYQYAWLMDDDGYPDKNALRLLMQKMDDGISCVSSTVVKETNPSMFVFPMPKLNSRGHPVVVSNKRKYKEVATLSKHGDSYPFAHLFNGALINLACIENVENINKSYFLYGDEVDFFCRLKQAGNVLSYFPAIHYHPDVSERPIDKIRVYYFIRNTIILNRKYFDVPGVRNLLTVAVAYSRLFKRNGVIAGLSYLFGKNLKYVYHGIMDGLKENYIKRY
jgi:rhamnopyranosyl-N-acetylglucosaminyl-diphospho-decaprenol beta-1,3/1,4-galactofuranosyltransferase